MMDIKIIKTEEEYEAALIRIDKLMDAVLGSAEAEQLELLSILVEKYEQEHYPINPPDPIDAIQFRMEQQGLTTKDMIPYLGSQSRVSEVLNRKRPLSLSMIRKLHSGLGIPLESLMQEPSDKFSRKSELNQTIFADISIYYNCPHLSEKLQRKDIKEWYSKVIERAQRQNLPSFEWRNIDQSLFEEFIRLIPYSAGPKMAEELLNNKGIHLIVQKMPIDVEFDGACFLLPERRPIISLTMQKDRLDDFWFTLLHLLAHLVLHRQEKPIAIFDSIECIFKKDAPEEEIRANRYLKEFLKSSVVLEKTRRDYKNAFISFSHRGKNLDTDINPALLSCLYRIENLEENVSFERSVSKKVSDKLEVYNA